MSEMLRRYWVIVECRGDVAATKIEDCMALLNPPTRRALQDRYYNKSLSVTHQFLMTPSTNNMPPSPLEGYRSASTGPQ